MEIEDAGRSLSLDQIAAGVKIPAIDLVNICTMKVQSGD